MKTLANFAATAGVTRSYCSGAHSNSDLEAMVRISDELETQLSAAERRQLGVEVSTALSAVPTSLKQTFRSVGGAVAFTAVDGLAKSCGLGDTKLGAAQRRYVSEGGKLEACWNAADADDATIYMLPEAAVIRHHTVRMMGRVLVEQLTERALATRSTAGGAAALVDFKPRLAGIFLKELRQAPAASSLSVAKVEAYIKNAGARAYMDAVFAEAFDAYFCSDDTRAEFQRTTPTTHATFAAFAKALVGTQEKGFNLGIKRTNVPSTGTVPPGFQSLVVPQTTDATGRVLPAYGAAYNPATAQINIANPQQYPPNVLDDIRQDALFRLTDAQKIQFSPASQEQLANLASSGNNIFTNLETQRQQFASPAQTGLVRTVTESQLATLNQGRAAGDQGPFQNQAFLKVLGTDGSSQVLFPDANGQPLNHYTSDNPFMNQPSVTPTPAVSDTWDLP